ncbi:MAG: insulinase family protein [Bacteroidetes bacterium]|nr:insulinase family protein [Bacteroidota bacterium]
MAFEQHQLPNGIRIIHKQSSSAVAHCGLIINAGSRDEKTEQQGLAHFIEHVIFKGTKKRKAFHILSRMEDVGGELNAFTTKEETCVYSSFMPEYYSRALELLHDITFCSTFPAKELKKEKTVVIDEINSYKDNPSEQIFDDFEEQLFEGHAIGKNILGTPDLVKSFNKTAITEFINDNYHSSEMIICSIGNIPFSKLIKWCEKYFSSIPSTTDKKKRKAFKGYATQHKITKHNGYQTHCMIGNVAYSASHPKKTALILLNNILGGPGMNSRLSLGIREKYGFTYHIESHYTPYIDTGIFNIYLASDKDKVEKSIKLVKKELKKFREITLGPQQLKKAKQQLIGQIAIGQESEVNLMLALGKSLLLYNKVDSFEEVKTKIEAVTAKDLQEVALEIFNEKQLSTLIFKDDLK